MTTLLEKAKSHRARKKTRVEYTKDHIELAVAWMNREITTSQACAAMGSKATGNVLYALAVALREGVGQGIVKVK